MTRSRITPPTQPLPWTVKRIIRDSVSTGYENDFAILDANGFWVASFGPVRTEADFVCAVVNQWQEGRK